MKNDYLSDLSFSYKYQIIHFQKFSSALQTVTSPVQSVVSGFVVEDSWWRIGVEEWSGGVEWRSGGVEDSWWYSGTVHVSDYLTI